MHPPAMILDESPRPADAAASDPADEVTIESSDFVNVITLLREINTLTLRPVILAVTSCEEMRIGTAGDRRVA